MLKQGSIADIKRGVISRDTSSYLVVAMRYYPRFLRKELRDEFLCQLAPTKELLQDFNNAQKRLKDHNQAFPEVDYEARFDLSSAALEHLERLAKMSEHKDVYLLCVCETGERCHREILMLMAKDLFDCPIGEVFHSYPVFTQKMSNFRARVRR